jgi:hypothetical protein
MPERLRPLHTAELVDASFALYRENFGLFAAIAGAVYVPFTVLSAIFGHGGYSTADAPAEGLILPFPRIGAGLVFFLLPCLSAVLVQGPLAIAVSDKYLGLPVTFASAYRRALGRALPLLATFALCTLAVAAGSCACILPGVVASVGLAFAPQIVVLEKLSATRALTRAWHLSRGDRFRMLGVFLLASMATVSIWATASVLGYLIFRSDVAADLFAALAARLAWPITHIALVLVYFDNRVRKEGFDLALLAVRIATNPRAPEPSVAGSAG